MSNEIKSLAEFVRETRENIGFSRELLAKRANLAEEIISDIESGRELFLSSTIRQKLAKGLKLNPSQILPYEKSIRFSIEDTSGFEDEIRVKMQFGETKDLKCPLCGSDLVFKTVKRYDLEDNLIIHHKASCVKCPFQIK